MSKLSAENIDRTTELHNAAMAGRRSEVERLLATDESNVFIHELNGNLEYPLYSSLALPAEHTLKLFEDKTAIFTQLMALCPTLLKHQNRDGDTVLHRIAKNGFTSLVEQVLSLEEPESLLTIQNNLGQTPIHTAVINARLGVATQLLEHKLVAQLLDHDGNLPLHLAAAHGSLEMVKACLKVYPDGINAKNNRDETPLDLAIRHNLEEIQMYLREQGGVTNPTSSWTETYYKPSI